MTLSRAAQSRSTLRCTLRKRAARELLAGTSELARESAFGPAKKAWFAIFGFYVQRYGSANRRMRFGFVKTSVKIAVLNALNISSLGAGTKYDCR